MTSLRKLITDNIRLLPIFLIIIFFVIIFRAKDIAVPFSYDEIVHGYIGKEIILKNKLLYVDAFDQKPFMVYVPHILSGIFDSNNQLSARIIGLLSSILVIFLSFFVLKKYFSATTASIFVIFETLLGNITLFEGNYNVLAEQQLKLPIVLLLFWFLSLNKTNRTVYLFTGGLIISWLTLIKQTYFLTTIPIIIFIYFSFKSFRKVISLIAGITIPWVIFTIPYLFTNNIDWFLLGVYSYNRKYYTGMNSDTIKIIFQYFQQPEIIISLLFVGILFFVSLIVYIKKYSTNNTDRRFLIFLSAVFISGLVSIFLAGSKLYPHYIQMLSFPIFFYLSIITGKVLPKIYITNKIKYFSITILFIIALQQFIYSYNNVPLYNNSLSNTDNIKIEAWITKYSNLYMIGQTISFYYDKKLPLTGNNIITALPFMENHTFFYNNFMKYNNLNIIAMKSDVLTNNRLSEYLKKYHICDSSEEVLLYCHN